MSDLWLLQRFLAYLNFDKSVEMEGFLMSSVTAWASVKFRNLPQHVVPNRWIRALFFLLGGIFLSESSQVNVKSSQFSFLFPETLKRSRHAAVRYKRNSASSIVMTFHLRDHSFTVWVEGKKTGASFTLALKYGLLFFFSHGEIMLSTFLTTKRLGNRLWCFWSMKTSLKHFFLMNLWLCVL